MAELKVETWPIERCIMYARNPRKNDEQVDRMASAIKEFGFRIPIVARSDGSVVDGHLRLKAAQRLGLKEVPVALADELTEAQVKAFRILANKSANWAEWDTDLLKLEIQELEELDFDLELTGFELEEIGEIVDKMQDEINDEGNPDSPPQIVRAASLDELAPTEEEKALFEGRKILVEYSGGKDSSSAAYWCRQFFPDAELELCFVDMGADFTGMNLFLKRFAQALEAKLVVLRSEKNVIDEILRKGKWPHFLFPYCHELLHGALDKYELKHGPEDIVIVRGGRLQEKSANGKKSASRQLVIERNKDYVYFQPFYFAEKGVGESLLVESGLPVWEGYGFGLGRTACRICPGQKSESYAALRAQYPEVWEELCALEAHVGTGYWQDKEEPKTATCAAMADRGEAAFRAKGLPRRFGS